LLWFLAEKSCSWFLTFRESMQVFVDFVTYRVRYKTESTRKVSIFIVVLVFESKLLVDITTMCYLAVCLSETLKYLSLTGNPLNPDNLSRLLTRYAAGKSLDDVGSNCTSYNVTSTPAARQRFFQSVQTVSLPLTRLSIGEMSVGNLTRDMLAQFRYLLRYFGALLCDNNSLQQWWRQWRWRWWWRWCWWQAEQFQHALLLQVVFVMFLTQSVRDKNGSGDGIGCSFGNGVDSCWPSFTICLY